MIKENMLFPDRALEQTGSQNNFLQSILFESHNKSNYATQVL